MAGAAFLLLCTVSHSADTLLPSPEAAIGRLGVRFGTVVAVEGTVIEGGKAEIPESQNANEGLFLRAESLDGKLLPVPAYLRLTVDPLVRIAPDHMPKISERVSLRGYEAGSFEGSPEAVWQVREKTAPPPAGWGQFRFVSVFRIITILKVHP